MCLMMFTLPMSCLMVKLLFMPDVVDATVVVSADVNAADIVPDIDTPVEVMPDTVDATVVDVHAINVDTSDVPEYTE